MIVADLDLDDDSAVPDQAVKGLDDATRRARQAGLPVVVVRQGRLVRLGPDGELVLKELPTRRKVAVRRKAARP